MRAYQILEAKSWASIIKDAEARGLVLANKSLGKKPDYVLSLPNSDELYQKVRGIVPWQSSNKLYARVTPRNYEEAAESLELIRDNFDAWLEQEKNILHSEAFAALQDFKGYVARRSFFKPAKYQLFMPRPIVNLRKKIRPLDTEVDPINEFKNAPVLARADVNVPPGRNKPSGAFWTSSLKEVEYKGKKCYTSDWVEWVLANQGHGNRESWYNPEGYVYTYDPNALILPLESDSDAQSIFNIFVELGRATSDEGGHYNLHRNFPWGEVAKHFDAVHHSGFRRDDFTYGWDCESTAWLNPSVLTLVAKVPICPVIIGDEDQW